MDEIIHLFICFLRSMMRQGKQLIIRDGPPLLTCWKSCVLPRFFNWFSRHSLAMPYKVLTICFTVFHL